MDVLATCGGPVILGRTGENDYTVVVFPFDGPAGASVTVFNRLPGSVSSYPVAAVEVQNSTVRWTVSSADLSVNGYGECEITYTLGDVVAKSVRYPTQVIASLDGQGDPPEGWDTWQAVFTALKAQAEAAAQTATDAAQTAESASEAIQNLSVSSTTLTPGSEATVEKTVDPETGVVNLEFGIPEGQQGETGPIGATPDISIGTVTTGAAGSSASATMTGTPENPVLNLTIPRGDKGKDGEDYVLTAADKAEIAQQAEELLAPALDNKAPIIINSTSGDIAHFTDGADNMPVKALTVNVEPVQDLHGYDSPWPAGGGKNKWSEGNQTVEAYKIVAIDIPVGDWTFSALVTSTTESHHAILFKENADGTGNTVGSATIGNGTGRISNSFGVTSPAKSVALYAANAWNESQGQTITYTDIQFESGLPATAYAPYSNICPISGWTGANIHISPTTDTADGQTYSITFPSEAGTVYGGTLDVTNGVLTVDRVIDTITGDSSWYGFNTGTGNSSAVVQLTNYQNVVYVAGVSSRNGAISSTGKEAQNYWVNARQNEIPDDGDMCFAYSQSGQLRVHRTDVSQITDLSAFKTNFPSTQIVYKLATPITYTLTPREIRTLLGTNNVWADTGDTAVSYRADTKLFVEQNAPESPVQDVQVNGQSVVQDGVANVPVAYGKLGVVRAKNADVYGIKIEPDGNIATAPPSTGNYKAGSATNKPVCVAKQHESIFYGLAKVAGHDEKNSALPLGQYTESAKSAIHTMLNAPVTVTGTTPTITALAGVQYVCGEVATLDITLPASGCVDVRFESGSTPTVLTITPPTGVTLKWAGGFDPTALDANTVYEINICDGLGVAASWT